MGESVSGRRPKRRTPQRAVSQNIRRSGKPLFFGWGAHLTHHEREQVKERIAAGIGILLALAIIAILGGGAVYTYVIKPSQDAAAKQAAIALQKKLDKKTYAIVGGVKISRGWYRKTLKLFDNQAKLEISHLQQAGSQYASLVSQIEQQEQSYPSNVYNEMIGNLVIEQKAAKIGAKVTPADEAKFIHQILKKYFHSSMSDFTTAAHAAGLTASQFKQFYLLQQYNFPQLTSVLNKRIPKTGVYVKVRHILLGVTKPTRSSFTSEKLYKAGLVAYRKQLNTAKIKAHNILRQLEAAGNTDAIWKRLVTKYSTDTSSKPKGGVYTWALASTYVPSFRNASEHWPLHHDGVIRSVYGYHVLEVLGRQNRKLSSTDLQTKQQAALNNWLTKAEKPKGYVVRKFTPPVSPTSGLTPGTP